jgi:uncharacterized protein (DUF58 family)
MTQEGTRGVSQIGATSGLKSLVIGVSGVFLFVVAILLDVTYLYMMAMSLFFLPLISYGIATFFPARLRAQRRCPKTVSESQRFPVTLSLNCQRGIVPTGIVVQERIPDGLKALSGSNIQRGLSVQRWEGGVGTLTYHLEPERRGLYTLKDLRAETRDPLGLFLMLRQLRLDPTTITVLPTPLLLRAARRGGEGIQGVRERDGGTRRGEGQDMHGVREYQHGDPLRRVHWRTSARTGKLAVVEYERALEQDIVIALDLSAGTNYGAGRESTLEYAVKIAVTLADQTLQAGGGVTLVTQTGKVVIDAREGDASIALFRIQDFLARVVCDSPLSLSEALHGVLNRQSAHIVVLTAQQDPALSRLLSERILQRDQVQFFFLEPRSFGGPQAMSPAIPGAALTIITKQDSPWEHGGKSLARLLLKPGVVM